MSTSLNSAATPARSPGPVGMACRIASRAGSILLVVFGVGILALALLAADGRGFFLGVGGHVVAGGAFGILQLRTRRRTIARRVLAPASILVNISLAFHLALLLLDGTLRGPMITAFPLLLGLPALVNAAAATMAPARPMLANLCPECGYDRRANLSGPCPECGFAGAAAGVDADSVDP